MEYLLSSLIGYLLGSIPTAYLVLKKVSNIDITSKGSGNVGAMNAMEVSNSKTLGLIVLLGDALKGLLSVYIPLLIFPLNFIYPALALFFAVLSHCYNPWLKLKGGRGLSTAAGGTLLLSPFIPAIWLTIWFIIFLIKKDIILANIWAIAATLLILFTSIELINKYTFPPAESSHSLLLFTTGLITIIFIKHIDPILELLNKKKFITKGKNEQKTN